MWVYEDLCVKEHYLFKVSIHLWVYGECMCKGTGFLQGKQTELGIMNVYDCVK